MEVDIQPTWWFSAEDVHGLCAPVCVSESWALFYKTTKHLRKPTLKGIWPFLALLQTLRWTPFVLHIKSYCGFRTKKRKPAQFFFKLEQPGNQPFPETFVLLIFMPLCQVKYWTELPSALGVGFGFEIAQLLQPSHLFTTTTTSAFQLQCPIKCQSNSFNWVTYTAKPFWVQIYGFCLMKSILHLTHFCHLPSWLYKTFNTSESTRQWELVETLHHTPCRKFEIGFSWQFWGLWFKCSVC